MDIMIDFNDKEKRKEIHQLLKQGIEEVGEQIKTEVDTRTLEALERLIETQERIIEEQEERIAIMSEGGLWNCVGKKPPKKREYVLVYNADIRSMSIRRIVDNDNFMGVFLTNGDSLIWEDIFEGYEIPIVPEEDYWMPLPEPPKEGET